MERRPAIQQRRPEQPRARMERTRVAMAWLGRNKELVRGLALAAICAYLGYKLGASSTGEWQGTGAKVGGALIGGFVGFSLGVLGMEGITAGMSSPNSDANVDYIRRQAGLGPEKRRNK